MLNKRNLPVLLLILACGLFFGTRTLGKIGKNPPSRYEKILKNVGEYLEQVHYSPKNLDDKFSREVFDKYLAKVDPDKNIFLQSDIQSLKKYQDKLDDEIKNGKVEFVPAVTAVFQKRIAETEKIYKELLSSPFDFTKDETAVFDADKTDFPRNEAERKESLRKRLKYLILDRYVELVEGQEKNKGKADFVAKTDAQLEKEARDRVLLIMDRMYSRYKFKINDDDRFSDYVNAITTSMDPHTAFFLPVDKRYFDEGMSGKFYGIGAALKEEDGVIKITSLVTGSPAWKSGEITAGDVIQKVAQGKEEPIDLTGYIIEDAVKLIRGTKGTEVRLTIKKVDGAVKVISLIRDEIVQDETFARSVIVNNGKSKVGYIFLPEFYADFDDPKGARCAIDVAKEVIKLKQENIDGIILDLRNNGGGSLYDVVQMVGLFIEDGPVVQVKDRDGKPSLLRDRDRSVLYDGPLAVMVNEFSASASEIFAAAIQDYKRGVIIGSTTTYGKGTVQRNIGLDKDIDFMSNSANSQLGTIKITLQKFYRINGGSTQLKGVSSDVVLPDFYEYSKLRERDDADALPWDHVAPADYQVWKDNINLTSIEAASVARVNSNESFKLIKKNTEWLAKQNDKIFSLNLNKFRQEKKAINDSYKQLEELNKLSKELSIANITGEENKYANDTTKAERFKAWMKNLKDDLYLNEAVNVVNDMVAEKNVAAATLKQH